MENYFGILRFAFLILLSLFLFEIIRTLNRNLESEAKSRSSDRITSLKVIEGAKFLGVEENHVYKIPDQCSLGRNQNNFIVVEDPFSSNFHAVIIKKKGKYYLSDMDSKNGTFHNDQQVSRNISLNKNDIIRIGGVRFKFDIE